jgi:hypothetical protein
MNLGFVALVVLDSQLRSFFGVLEKRSRQSMT